MPENNFNDFLQATNLTFNDEALLEQAFRHRSYINEQDDPDLADNERLEFLGDAVLGFVAADMLYKRFPEMSEGELTRLRAALVRTESLAELARICHIGDYLIIGKGEENNGGRKRITNLCRGFEAVVGALYLDQGLDAVREFIIPHFSKLQHKVITGALEKDARSQLQEWSQGNLGVTPQYRLKSATGPDHNKEFCIEVLIDNKVVASGIGRSKQLAAQDAASNAIEQIENDTLNLED